MKLLFVIGILPVLCLGVDGSFISWIFGGESSPRPEISDEQTTSDPSAGSSAASSRRAPFEMKSAEHRFLKAGEDYMAGLSELDTCHHRVIADLETSCNDITEEELGKLGVALLNCQSQSEGRPTFTCTKDMTLAECTRGMDATTWNTYHIISDRSRSVCYGVRQQQFQRQTRYAVNQLAATAADQLNVMENLMDGQDALQSVASDTLQIMSDGQQEIIQKQAAMKDSQGELQQSIQGNLQDLTSEKALIAAGHRELAQMTDNIRQQLDNATKQLLNQDQDIRQNHKELQKDLTSIHRKAKEAFDKLDGNMQHVTFFQDETFQYYKETIDNLKKMNDTINYLLNLVNDMQTGIDERLGWLTSLVGGLGENLTLLSTCVTHCAYFLLASLCVTFLHTPTFSRIVLLLLVPLNAISEVKHGASLDFSGLTILITGVVLANWVVLLILKYQGSWNAALGTKPPADYTPASPCQCKHVTPRFIMPPAVNRSLGLGDFSDDEDYTLPTDLSAITGEHTSHMFNSGMLSESSAFSNDTTLTGSNVTDNWFTTLNNDKSVDKMNDVRGTPMDSSLKTPMPSSPSILGFGDLRHTNPARRHLAAALQELPKPVPSPRSQREGTPSSSRPSTPGSSRASTPGKRLCNGITKSGQPCRLACSQGSDYCFRHADN
ncbi:protein brambleberry-like isoform X2 [Patiria miniata]|uniref:Protein brambleberry n=1 Tax=Patiria miniata TaxID=46514 RepID=A0A914AE88_PATMI|nr:protein brambleberry-like isoform X2 [Patiria miniata]